MRCFSPRTLSVAVLVLCVSAWARAEQVEQDSQKKQEFLRFVDDGHGGGKLESAIVTYKNDTGVTVHLVGAVHIGEKAYYKGLNKTFQGYDAVLYEMVKPRDAGPPQPGEERNNSIISVIQRFMKDTLELQFQLDAIDYTKPNFVHADLDWETFQKLEEERGESIWTLMLQQMLKQLTDPPEDQPEISLEDLLDAITSPHRANKLKLLLARQFNNIEQQMSAFAGTVLITERNKACFKVLDKQIADGKKDIGIFYGAGHMGDMQKRLVKRGFHKTGEEWRVAWDMTRKTNDADDDEDVKPAPKKARPQHDADDDADASKVLYLVR